VAVWTAASPLFKNQSWDDNPDLFGVKITRDLARVFLKQTTLTVSLLDFLNSNGDSNHDVGSPFCHFGNFSSLKALDGEFGWFYDMFLSPYTLSTDNFFPANFFATLTSAAAKMRTSILALTRLGSDI
jgi:hypothetical protein